MRNAPEVPTSWAHGIQSRQDSSVLKPNIDARTYTSPEFDSSSDTSQCSQAMKQGLPCLPVDIGDFTSFPRAP